MALNRWLRGYRGPEKAGAGGGGGGGVPDPHAASHLSDGSDPITAASTTVGGLLSAADKVQLNNLHGRQTVNAAGTDQTGATAISATGGRFVEIAAGTSDQGIKLPTSPVVGDWYMVKAASAVLSNPGIGQPVILLYPGAAGKFRHRNANISIPVYAFQSWMIHCTTGGASPVWEAIPLMAMFDGFAELAFSQVFNHYNVYTNTQAINVYGNIQIFNGAPIVYAGGTGSNVMRFPDNLDEAFYLGEGTNRYLGIKTTNSDEALLFYKKISGYLATVNTQTVDYTLVLTAGTGDSGKVVEIDSGTDKQLTLPATAAVGMCATVTQVGVGRIEFITTGSGSIVNANTHTKTRTQYSVCTVYCRANVGGSAAVWVLSGDTGA